jgi:XTP/dITP diphosphohydrolase
VSPPASGSDGTSSPARRGGAELVVATGNAGKLRELREILAGLGALRLRSLAGFPDAKPPDEGDDYRANAIAKARSAARATGLAAIADDSGLEVAGLDGRPGPHSSRYGGPGLDDAGRVAKLLEELEGQGGAARVARFVCVAAFATPDGAVEVARGECAGAILEAPQGAGGFGYDPVFRPEGETLSMAELPAAAKNHVSHRARALQALEPALEKWLGVPHDAEARETRFVLVRHGESEWNALQRWQGQADPPLSARGIAQAEALAERLRGGLYDRLLASDLQRARHTAEILGRALGLPVQGDARLRELDVGGWEGRTRSEIEALDADALARFDAGDPDLPAGGGESRADIRRRVRARFRELRAEHPGETLVVVTHLGVVRALSPGSALDNCETLDATGDELVLDA